MATARQEYTLPKPILSPGAKSLLQRSHFGLLGLRVARAIRQAFRKTCDPIQHKIWLRQFVLPLRNAIFVNQPLTLSIGEVSILLAPRGSTAGDNWAGLRRQNREGDVALGLLKPGMIFFDVGANAGLFAIGAAKKIGGQNVFAFEPCSSTCDLLRQNLKLNHITDLHVVQQALGERVGGGMLKIDDRGRDDLNTLRPATAPSGTVVGFEEVSITTLDTFMTKQAIPRVDAIKVDIGDTALMFFRGAKELLQRPDAPVIWYEGSRSLTPGFGYHPVEILWFLDSCGYNLFTLNGDTGEIADLTPDYQYNSTVIAAKPLHAAYRTLRGVAR